MHIESGAAHGAGIYWTVLVDTDELVVASGKALPYPTRIGTIDARGKVNIWTPAAYVPRGYKEAAKELLEQARDTLIAEGKITARPRHANRGYTERDLANRAMHSRNYARAYGGSTRGTTLAQARDHMKTMGFSLRKKDGEYRVNFEGGSEATAYYTDDLADAVATADSMAASSMRGGR